MGTNGGTFLPSGGRFDFDDGGTYCGGWVDGKAHGHGVCTGPRGLGEFAGSWHEAFEVSGVYVFPGGSGTYEGQWQQGRRHGLGVETRGRWVYRGEWTQGFKGRYGVRQSLTSGARYEGTWANGLQDGYGSETYADGGTFQGQWQRGMRHGYGVRSSAPYAFATRCTLGTKRGLRPPSPTEPVSGSGEATDGEDDEDSHVRGGFVLRGEPSPVRPSGWKKARRSNLQKEDDGRDTMRSLRISSSSSSSFESGISGTSSRPSRNDASSPLPGDVPDRNVIETYMGEWKNDRRSGFGIAERSDGVKYEGEWRDNKKCGYGVTTFKNGTIEEGKYINNVLVSTRKRSHIFFMRTSKFYQKLEASINAAVRSSQIALQKADIAISRTATARGKAEQAELSAHHAREDAKIARMVAKQLSPDFFQSGGENLKQTLSSRGSTDFLKVQEGTPKRSRSFHISARDKDVVGASKDLPIFITSNEESPCIVDSALPPAQSALLDVFRNNPDRRPSAASFLRRGSTYVEHKLNPQTFQQKHFQNYSNKREDYTLQNAIDDHYSHYYQKDEYEEIRRKLKAGLKAVKRNVIPPKPNHSVPLSYFYGEAASPDTSSVNRMDDEEPPPTHIPRRSTLPTVLTGDSNQINLQPFNSGNDEGDEERGSWGTGEGVVRTGSLHSVPRRPHGQGKAGASAPRKKSLPDITRIENAESNILSRETVALLSSQRREAIRRQEEEAQRLKGNPFLYLMSPELKDWLSRQQLLILVLFINISLAILFFKLLS